MKKTFEENPKVWNIFYLNHGLVLELEFNEFARGKWEITELEFAEMLMRYTDSWDMDEQIKEVKTRLKNQKGNVLTLSTEAKFFWEKNILGITLDEFKAFFFFLNNLEDFSTAVHYYSLANQDQFSTCFWSRASPRITDDSDLIDLWTSKSQLDHMSSLVLWKYQLERRFQWIWLIQSMQFLTKMVIKSFPIKNSLELCQIGLLDSKRLVSNLIARFKNLCMNVSYICCLHGKDYQMILANRSRFRRYLISDGNLEQLMFK